MVQNMKDKGIDPGLIKCFKYVLENREIVAELQGEVIRWLANRGSHIIRRNRLEYCIRKSGTKIPKKTPY